ncbi:hypothetical protein BC829DRAFT_5959 [Chytridium lagenaria]|nr:hypothetical protein BC829DRAFT_5959 [Chytridium lagenaria]
MGVRQRVGGTHLLNESIRYNDVEFRDGVFTVWHTVHVVGVLMPATASLFQASHSPVKRAETQISEASEGNGVDSVPSRRQESTGAESGDTSMSFVPAVHTATTSLPRRSSVVMETGYGRRQSVSQTKGFSRRLSVASASRFSNGSSEVVPGGVIRGGSASVASEEDFREEVVERLVISIDPIVMLCGVMNMGVEVELGIDIDR